MYFTTPNCNNNNYIYKIIYNVDDDHRSTII